MSNIERSIRRRGGRDLNCFPPYLAASFYFQAGIEYTSVVLMNYILIIRWLILINRTHFEHISGYAG
jgi:hypothetical protein